MQQQLVICSVGSNAGILLIKLLLCLLCLLEMREAVQ